MTQRQDKNRSQGFCSSLFLGFDLHYRKTSCRDKLGEQRGQDEGPREIASHHLYHIPSLLRDSHLGQARINKTSKHTPFASLRR